MLLNIPDAELEVLKALWKSGPATIRELTARIYPQGGTSAYSTVQKLLERLIAQRHKTLRLCAKLFYALILGLDY